MPTRKEQALTIMQTNDGKKVASIVFAMLDGKGYTDIIWKMLRPKYELPFKKEI